MTSASFFALSVALHIAAMAYPVVFAARDPGNLISITLVPAPTAPALAKAGGGRQAASSAGKSGSSHGAATGHAQARAVEQKAVSPAPQNPAEKPTNPGPEGGATVAPPSANVSEPIEDLGSEGYPMAGNANLPHSGEAGDARGGTGAGTTGGNGSADSGGRGRGSGGAGAIPVQQITQASYRDTPRPEYPESARRQGREGRVLLRVLVDEHGRSKRVEISSSSGSDALDRAAAEAIRRWRFDPARYGDQAIESWLRIPIEFRLTDATNG